jgi:HK97 family phage portal protein
MPWPFRRKAGSPVADVKNASFLLGLGTGRGSLTGAAFDRLATEGFAQNAVVNACVNKIASSIASVEPTLYRRTGDKLVKVDDHPLLDLLANPNPTQSGKEFMRYLVSYYLTGGNAYVFGNGINPMARKPGPPTELQMLNPGKVKVEPGPALFPKQFEYKPTPTAPALVYPVEQVSGRAAVLQFKTFNPLSPWYGLPPMLAAAFGIDIHNGGNLWNKKLLDNEARPSGALMVEGADGKPATLSDDQYQRVKEMIDDQYSGSHNAGRPLLLEGGLKWQEMSLNPKDMDFLKAKDSSARDIGLVFGVPSQLLQIPGDSTFANFEQATLSFWTDTVIPLLCWFLEGFNRWLTPRYGDDLYLWYDEDAIAALEPRRKEKFSRITQANFMTIDEKRRALGMDDFPHKLGKALLLEGRGVLLGEDGSIVALATNTNVDSVNDPLTDNYQGPAEVPTTPNPEAPPPVDPNAAAKHRAWLVKEGYTVERAEHLTKLVYG